MPEQDLPQKGQQTGAAQPAQAAPAGEAPAVPPAQAPAAQKSPTAPVKKAPAQKTSAQAKPPAAKGGKKPARLQKINREFQEKAVATRAKELGVSYVNIEKTPINPDLLHILPKEEVLSGLIMPFFKIGKRLRIAIADPENENTRNTLKKLRDEGYQLNVNLASDASIRKAAQIYDTELAQEKKIKVVSTIEEEKIQAYEKEIKNLSALREKLTQITSEEALNLINVGAIKTGASDIHFQPEETHVKVRFRIDGVLQTILEIDTKTFVNIANQVKYKAKLKLNITNIPQDGRYNFIINKRKIDVRVSALPTEYGETFVCRLLDSARSLLTFEDLGYTGNHLTHIKKASALSHGMVLVTGPTGSGKTTTLYTILDEYNSPERKIITLEDPIEYHVENISQSQINDKRDYTFANGLKAVLRQDPDIVMIGEIRDVDTANTAAQAALTGHVLLSTLHTNSAVESIPRLRNIGLPPFMIAPALHTIIAQRLVRKICPDCHTMEDVPEGMLKELTKNVETIQKIHPQAQIEIPKQLPMPNDKGCDTCSHTGYKGRIQIVEMLEIDNEMKGLILEEVSSIKLIEAARRSGMLTMREDGILKVIAGITSLEEVHRMTNVSV